MRLMAYEHYSHEPYHEEIERRFTEIFLLKLGRLISTSNRHSQIYADKSSSFIRLRSRLYSMPDIADDVDKMAAEMNMSRSLPARLQEDIRRGRKAGHNKRQAGAGKAPAHIHHPQRKGNSRAVRIFQRIQLYAPVQGALRSDSHSVQELSVTFCWQIPHFAVKNSHRPIFRLDRTTIIGYNNIWFPVRSSTG